MTDQDRPPLTGDEPITARTIVNHALQGTDLPPLEDKPFGEWAAKFTDKETARRLETLIAHARVADVAGARHWAHQTEDAFLRASTHGKDPRHR